MKKNFLLLILGSILEYYDFAIYIFFAKNIGADLIPVHDTTINMIATFSIFAIGALIRPLGGMIFAHYGDKNGRKGCFSYSILLMAVCTFAIALIPSYHLIGLGATVLLLSLRALQGAAVGGEIPAAMIFAYEISAGKKRALNVNIVMAGTNLGLFFASCICGYLLNHFSSQLIAPWRIAFIIGGVFGIISYFLRKNLNETPEFKKIMGLKQQTLPLKEVITKHKPQLYQMLAFTSFIAALVATFTAIMPNYLIAYKAISQSDSLQLTSYSLMIFTASALLAGKFDWLFNKYYLVISTLVFDILIIWLFFIFDYADFTILKYIYFIILGYIGIICGRLPVIISSYFPTKVRYSGVALSYNISFGVIAGLSPMVIFALIKSTNYLWVPAIYLILFSVPALWFLINIKSKQLYSYY